MIGPRSFNRTKAGVAANAPDIYSGGWAFNPVTEDLYNFMKDDPRLNATIMNVKNLLQMDMLPMGLLIKIQAIF